MVIVTQNQYILASKIFHVTLNEEYDWKSRSGNSSGRGMYREYKYTITVLYAPEVLTNNSREDKMECVVVIRGALNAYKIYKDLINQIREQLPDQLFLDKAIENILNQEDLEKIKIRDDNDLIEERLLNDAITNEVRRAGKAKRSRKKVLRRSKGSNRSRR